MKGDLYTIRSPYIFKTVNSQLITGIEYNTAIEDISKGLIIKGSEITTIFIIKTSQSYILFTKSILNIKLHTNKCLKWIIKDITS